MAQATILTKLKATFLRGDIVTRLLFINVGLYLAIRLSDIVISLVGGEFMIDPLVLHWLGLPANLSELLLRPWTLITGFFVHLQFLHLLFNMLWLFWFGRLFLTQFKVRHFGGLYLLGGLLGGIIYLLAYNLFPLLQANAAQAVLIGASGAILAIVVATAMIMPMAPIQTLFGAIRLKYIAIVAVVLSVLELNGSNAGGNFAHLGGALAGYLFVIQYKKGKDLLRPYNQMIDFFATLFRPKPKMKVKYNRPSNVDYNYRDQKNSDNHEIDAILDKLKKSGYNSLTKEEKQKLFEQKR